MITIIIPAHNESESLKSLLKHLSYSVDDETEIIVALSRSNKEDCEKLKPIAQIQFLECSGTGRALQMNEAVSVSKGDVFVFLHADVIPPKSFLPDIKEAIGNKYDAGFFSYRFDKENFFLKINASFTAKDGIFTGGGDQCLFIKKTTFYELGRFDEEQVVMEDFEFFKRMKKNKIRYKIIKNDLIVSARKYQYNSYIRVNFSNLLLVLLFKLGYPSGKLKTLHDRLIRTPYQNRS